MSDAFKIGLMLGIAFGAASIMDVIENSVPADKKPAEKPQPKGLGQVIKSGSYVDESGQEINWTLRNPKSFNNGDSSKVGA